MSKARTNKSKLQGSYRVEENVSTIISPDLNSAYPTSSANFLGFQCYLQTDVPSSYWLLNEIYVYKERQVQVPLTIVSPVALGVLLLNRVRYTRSKSLTWIPERYSDHRTCLIYPPPSALPSCTAKVNLR